MNEQKRDRDVLKKQKKIILITIAALVAVAVLYFLISMIDFDSIFNKNKETAGADQTPENIYFYDESYSKYPSEDEWYMNEAFKNITYVYGRGTVFSEEIRSEDDAKSRSEPFYLLYKLIEYIKNGDHESYNECFSSHYYKTHSEQAEFTKQKIYDIIITEVSEKNKSDGSNVFIEYTYTIEYRIRHNNGSLRKDIGSGQSKKQYVTISKRTGQGFLIDDMFTLKESVIS